jgi:hypothetical protein
MSASIVSRLDWLTGEIRDARHVADKRLAILLGQLSERGVAASGARGDELGRDAFADVMRDFNADHILFAVPANDRRPWQWHGLVDHLLERFGVPVTVFAIGARRHAAVIGS